MDLSYLNSIPADRLEEYLSVASTLSLSLDASTLASLEEYIRQEKQLLSKLSTFIDTLSQKHSADVKGYLQNHEYLKKPVVEAIQKTMQRWHITESSTTGNYM